LQAGAKVGLEARDPRLEARERSLESEKPEIGAIPTPLPEHVPLLLHGGGTGRGENEERENGAVSLRGRSPARPIALRRFATQGGSRPVSRVLSGTVIHLGRTSPHASSDLPGSRRGPRRAALSRGSPPYLVLLRVGFTLPPRLRGARCALTAPFHPYLAPPRGGAGGIFSVALSVDSRPPGVTWHPALRSPDFPPRRSSPGAVAARRLSGRLPRFQFVHAGARLQAEMLPGAFGQRSSRATAVLAAQFQRQRVEAITAGPGDRGGEPHRGFQR